MLRDWREREGGLLEEENTASTGRAAFILSPVTTGICRFNYGVQSCAWVDRLDVCHREVKYRDNVCTGIPAGFVTEIPSRLGGFRLVDNLPP
ncbi:hypothetical protein VTI28DRAFT_5430 [Corynascus sepedonium]